MKLITLNTWAGRVKEPFDSFLKNHAVDTDIFCFQEIFNDLDDETPTSDYINHDDGRKHILKEISDILTSFDVYFCPVASDVYGIAIFLKKGMEIIASGEVMLYENPSFDPADEFSDHNRKMQWMHIKKDRKDFIVMNVHGHWGSKDKSDTLNHLEQSKKINDFIATTGSVPKILVGDFNLLPETESIKMLEKSFTNLITKYKILTTRTNLYKGLGDHADYVFVSDEILTEGFNVLPDIVSDHAPLVLDFDVF